MRKAIVGVAAIVCISVILYVSYDSLYGFLRPHPNFEISADPDSVLLRSYKGSSNATAIIVKSVNGFSGDVSIKLEKSFGMMGDIWFDLDSYDLRVPPDGQDQCELSLLVVSFVTAGDYYVDIVATSGQIEHSVRIRITVLS